MDSQNKNTCCAGKGWFVGVVVVVAVVIVGYFIFKSPSEPFATEPVLNKPVSVAPIKIGVVGPLTGDMANIGENMRAAVEIATEEINLAGGISGRQLNIIYEDSKCVGKEGSSAVSKLINIDKVSAILGDTCSSSTLAQAPISEKAKVVQLSYCSTAPDITNAGDYIFRDVPSDLFQAKFAANYIYNKLGKKKVAILFINNDWGNGIDKAFNDAFLAIGGQIVNREGYDLATKDLRSQLTKIKGLNPEVVYFAGFTDSTIAGLKQAKELGLKNIFFGADSWDDTKIWNDLGIAGNDAIFTVVGTASTDDFKAKMQAKLNKPDIIYCSNYAYDGLKVLAKGLSSVGGDATKLKDALYNINYTGGVSAETITFDKNGDPVTFNYIVKKVQDGKVEIVK